MFARRGLDAVRSSPARTDTVAVQAASVLARTEHRQYLVSCVFALSVLLIVDGLDDWEPRSQPVGDTKAYFLGFDLVDG